MLSSEALACIRPFTCHGFHPGEMNSDGKQFIGNCPFCGKDKHFFLNWKERVWDCKVCGKQGNLPIFLEKIGEKNRERFLESRKVQRKLSQNRGLPIDCWQSGLGERIGFDGLCYTLPIRDWNGKVSDIRRFRIGGKFISTPGCKVGLFGIDQLGRLERAKSKVNRIIVAEGEWDAIAYDWLQSRQSKDNSDRDCVTGVPGAGTFKPEWVPAFLGKDTVLLYDNDPAGEQGREIAIERLHGSAGKLYSIEWSKVNLDLPIGYDIRDFVIDGAVAKGKPKTCYKELQAAIGSIRYEGSGNRSTNRSNDDKGSDTTKSVRNGGSVTDREIELIGRKKLVEVFRRWLYLAGEEPLASMFGAVLANIVLEGDPVWLFIVAPPGGGKSELLMSLSDNDWIVCRTGMTPHALVSGMQFGQGSADPSLIPRLDGRVLVIKDFTGVLTMPPPMRDEIFGQLRDAYDGRLEKQFGNGILREYESHFGIIAGVVPSIDSYSSLASLGERFLKFRLEDNIKHLREEDRIRMALGNVNRELGMREELNRAAKGFLFKRIAQYTISSEEKKKGASPPSLPIITPEYVDRIVALSQIICRLRGVVLRDKYSPGILGSKAYYEVATRLAKQFAKVAIGVAMYYGHETVGDDEWKVVRRIARDTAPDKVEEILGAVYKVYKESGGSVEKGDIIRVSTWPSATIYRVMEDMEQLRIVRNVNRVGGGKKQWIFGRSMEKLIRQSGIWG